MARPSLAGPGPEGKERRLLAAALRGEEPGPGLDPEAGERLVVAASDHGVLGMIGSPWLEALPADAREKAETLLAEARLGFRRLERVWELTGSAFEEAQIRAVTIKGPPLAERLYGRDPLRFSTDLDYLVAGEALSDAAACLEGIGCRREGSCLVHPSGVPVDLHGGGAPKYGRRLDTDAAMARSIPWRSARGIQSWRLDPTDELLHLLSHVAKHRAARLAWSEDVCRHRRSEPAVTVSAVAERARDAGLSLVLMLGARAVVRELEVDRELEDLAARWPGIRVLLSERLARQGGSPGVLRARWPGLHRALVRALVRETALEGGREIAGYVASKARERWSRGARAGR